jgi:hypothetical protein
MRILLDECIDERFRLQFGNHDCQTARYAKFAGLTNGRLLLAADTAGFDVLITVDQGIPHQQNVGQRRIALIVLRVPTNRVGDLIQLVPAIVSALDSIAPGQVVMLP